MNGVGVMNFFNVTNSSEAEISYNNMKNRAEEIISKNEWLMGRLRRPKETELHVFEADCDPKNYIKELTGDQYFVDDLLKKQEPLFELQIGKASDCLKKNTALFVIYFVKNKEFTKFGVFLSINHIIADGATMYKIFNMLDSSCPIESMDRSYVDHRPYMVKETSMCSKNGKPLMVAQTGNILKSILVKSFARRKLMNTTRRIQVFCYDFDMDKIKEVKNKFSNGTEYVSTNDVMHHWLTTLNPKNDRTQMAVNLRKRVSVLNELTAGNYEDLIETHRNDQISPLTVRKCLAWKLQAGGHSELASFAQMKKFLGGMTTNWGSFFKPWNFKGAEFIEQVPLLDLRKETLDFKIFGFRFTCEENAVLIQRTPGQFAFFMWSASGAVSKEKLDKDPLLKQCLFHCDPFKQE